MEQKRLGLTVASGSITALTTSALLLWALLFQACKKTEQPPDALAQGEEVAAAKKDHGNDKGTDIKLVADGFASPLGVVDPGDNSKRLFVIDQIGKICVIDKHGNRLTTPFLDISAKLVTLNVNGDERGLLGLAFHPDYKHNGKFYVYYQAPPRPGGPTSTTLWNNFSKLVEYRVSANNPNLADASTERLLLGLDDPQANHNGGTLQFGPADDYLYWSIGDGGGANDINVGHVADWYLPNAGGNGQDIEANLFGNILRLDVNGTPYRIPPDNPFVNKPGLDEIWAFGLRNPYRFSIDMEGNHDLIVGDVGQRLYEEINLVKKGGNYGWNVKEGYTCFNAADALTPLTNCPTVDDKGRPLIDPVIVMNNFQNPAGGRTTIAIIGGNVYRGSKLDQFKGKYIFGSYTQSPSSKTGELFVADMKPSGPWSFQEISLVSRPNDLGALLKGFGQDRKGELYITVSDLFGPTGNTGKVYKLVRADDDQWEDEDDD